MTTAEFHMTPVSLIWVNREKRQRRELLQIEELAASIREVGLINPLLITRENELIAGERRFSAVRLLQWDSVPTQYTDEIDPARLHLIELEENVKRSDLSWQEINKAVVDYHNIRLAEDPSWSQEKTADALNMWQQGVSDHLTVAQAAKIAPELNVMQADVFSTAKGLAKRAMERRQSTVMENILGEAPLAPKVQTLSGESLPIPKKGEILNVNFREWLSTNTERFNFIHCDFPYGVNTGSKTSGQSGTKRLGHYDDSEGVYWDLLELFCASSKKLCEPQAHLIFWFSMNFYHETKTQLERAGWRIDPFPLIWHKTDNSGIIPDSNRGGRRGYECALLGSRGDRKIVRPVSNIYGCSNPRENHAHEKPQEMLRHFFGMLVDGSTSMLDPTCGSGSAVKAAEACGASRMLGLELNAEFAERARRFVAA